MTPKPLLARIVVAASAVAAPLWAQTPLFTDGGAFGGSKVFSEGMNPLGNPARTSQAPQGWYFSFLDGDQRAQDNKSILGDTASADPVAASAALDRLNGAPWALRTRAYGIQNIKDSASLCLTREQSNGMLAHPDLDPTHLGTAGLAGNTSTLDGRRTTVDRLSLGGGGPVQQGLNLGAQLRIERWAMGRQVAQFGSPGPGFGDPESAQMTFTATSPHTLGYGPDFGLDAELAPGVRVGATLDQLNSRTLWDVHLKPQVRAGLQLDFGQSTKLSLEADLNAVEKMPFPVKQKAAGASLRFALSPSAVLLVGAEQRRIADVATTRGGVTLQLRLASMLIALGFQAGQDRPMKGATLMVN